MALVVYDRVQESTTTAGTGSVTLGGAVAGFQSFAVVGNGNTTYYCIVDTQAGTWEVGIGTYSTTGPTLARTTVLSNSSGTTSPITLSSSSNTKSVFVTYPSEKSVNLDASGNVTALGTITSAVWHGTTIPVAYGGTGVTTSSGANSVVLRDASQNIVANNIELGYQNIATSGGTTTFTAASPFYTQFTGTSSQTLVMPDATTLPTGANFYVDNDSTQNITVKDGAGTTFELLIPGGIHSFVLENNSTVAGTWLRYSLIPSEVEWGTNSLQLNSTVITGGYWRGNTVETGYGGTGLTGFSAANNAIYSTSSTTLAAGTLPVAAGGTGKTSITAGYIPYGNGTSPLNTSSSLQFSSGVLVVGGASPLGGATNPITAFSSTANNYIQTYIYNTSASNVASADFVAYADNSSDSHGWADIGFTSSTYASTDYSITGPNEAYVLGSAPANVSATGNLVYATDSTGTANAHQWYVGGFNKAKNAWTMQLTSTGLQLANALSATYGGTGLTSPGTSGNVLTSDGSGWTSAAAPAATPTGGAIWINSETVSSNVTINSGYNGFMVGPMNVSSGVSVTVASGQRLVII